MGKHSKVYLWMSRQHVRVTSVRMCTFFHLPYKCFIFSFPVCKLKQFHQFISNVLLIPKILQPLI